ncbi:MAG: Fe-S cluster assembly protein SufB [Candidatus Woesearchaeota archaeon]|nr:Fe-S cluster assembly protein SufB [Candidatus Woesearchaeota archaeon]
MKDVEKNQKEHFVYKAKKGVSEQIIRDISKVKNEPEWMLNLRLEGLRHFFELSLPKWAPEINVNFDDVYLYLRPAERTASDWDEVPEEIKETFDKLGIPEAEREFLAGSGAQFESEMIYRKIKESLAKQGVIFTSMDEAVKLYPDLVKKYFGKLIPSTDNKFAALNTAAWSGGTFLYVPKNVKVDLPLQTYFRMNFEGTGQFERSLIIVEEGASVHYIEGCTAPLYSKASLHAGVVEVFVHKNGKMRYTTIQNWSKNVLNLTTKRGLAEENAVIEWVDGNLGSGINMKYPAIILKGDNSRGDILGISIAGKNQNIDAGAKIIALGKNVRGKIVSKGISFDSGIHTYRGFVFVDEKADNAVVDVSCDALMLDDNSFSNTYPRNKIKNKKAIVKHEATVGKLDEDALFYLMSRGIKEEDAKAMLVLGFLNPVAKELPMEYAVEFNKLLKMQFENAIG